MSMFTPTRNDLFYILNHVFLPPKLPQKDEGDDARRVHDIALASLAHEAAVDFLTIVPAEQKNRWSAIINMLRHLKHYTDALNQDDVVADMTNMNEGDVLTMHVRAQNAGLIIRKLKDIVRFEVFEVSPPPEAVMKTTGKLICSYPGPAVDIPLDVATEPSFLQNLASFLVQMDVDELDALPTTKKAGSVVPEERSTAHPRYISELLMGILLAIGKEADISRVTKRIADDVLWKSAFKPWRRSPLWLVIRVALQTSLPAIDIYKQFLLSFHTKLLWLFYEHDLPSDFIFCARAKTARRAYKLGSLTPGPLLQEVQDVTEALEELMQRRWSAVQAENATLPSFPSSSLDFLGDTNMSLPNSRAFLTEALSNRALPIPIPATFQPSESPRLRDNSAGRAFSSAALREALANDCALALADFEHSVETSIDEWVMTLVHRRDTTSPCEDLGSCFDAYVCNAEKFYKHDTGDQSMMLLTMMELWVAIDKLTVAEIPLLAQYSPEIPTNIFHSLLLRRSASIDRANALECYLSRRHKEATSTMSVFSHQMTPLAFPVRFFDQSLGLQNVKLHIEEQASSIREAKKHELEMRNGQVRSNLARAASMEHNHSGPGSKRMKSSCSRCRLEKKARLSVHEWPLPDRAVDAKAVVFELKCPPTFGVWRDRTYSILRDFGLAHVPLSHATQYVVLQNYDALRQYSANSKSSRLTLGSDTKSFLQAHYKKRKLPAEESSICVQNGLHFRLYDQTHREWASSPFSGFDISGLCTLSLPDHSPYYTLQYAVSRTDHTSNEIMASQEKCPNDLNIHEYIAFLGLRSGPRLQWLNIAREMHGQTLSFHRVEVSILVEQAACQLGPLLESDDGLFRELHAELHVPEFGMLLVKEASGLIAHARVGWTEVTTIRTALLLISQLLAFSPNNVVCEAAYMALRSARTITLAWMREISDRIHLALAENERHELRVQLCQVAMTCRATYDVDPRDHLPRVLCFAEDVATIVECSITLNIHTPSNPDQLSSYFRRLLSYDRRLSYHLEPLLSQLLLSIDGSLDLALRSIWPSYRPSSGSWRRLSEPNSRWVSRRIMTETSYSVSQDLHYNTITGSLLLNGAPLDRLPQDIAAHPAYTRIFGQKVFDIVPANMAGMQFSTRYLVHGYQIFFSFDKISRTIEVRAKSSTGNVFLLVPHDRLIGDFPQFLVTEYVHFLNLDTGEIEFRPLESIWDETSISWRLHFSALGRSSMLSKSPISQRLVDIHSQTFKRLANIFARLDYPDYLHVTYRYAARTAVPMLTIGLPRFRLFFFLNDQGDLESSNLPGMLIDRNQSSGTMIGLQNQLVLRQKQDAAAGLPRSRRVIVPHGRVKPSLSDDFGHVKVYIDNSSNSQRHLRWYEYGIDEDLGCLVGSVELTSRLYRIYLHAVCSHSLPDPLTGQTGIEVALNDLRSAACFSFQQLKPSDIELLQNLRSLTPRRSFYPAGKRLMQTVFWSPDIPFLCQHSSFEPVVQDILSYGHSLSTIFPDHSACIWQQPEDSTEERSTFLRKRAAMREVLEKEMIADIHDSQYISRAHLVSSEDCGAVVTAARQIISQPDGRYQDTQYTNILPLLENWSAVSGPSSLTSLTYDASWLPLDLSAHWIALYNELRHEGDNSTQKHKLLFSLSAMAYSSPDLRHFVPVLLAFNRDSAFLTRHPPSHEQYDISTGFKPTHSQIRTLILSASKDLGNTPAASFFPETNATNKKLQRARQDYHHRQCVLHTDEVVERVLSQWPSVVPYSPFLVHDEDWFEVGKAMSLLRGLFMSISQNKKLRTHFVELEEILRSHFVRKSVEESLSFSFPSSYVNVSSERVMSVVTWSRLLVRDPPAAVPPSSFLENSTIRLKELAVCSIYETMEQGSSLENLSMEFRNNPTQQIYRLYGERLERSRKALDGLRLSSRRTELPHSTLLHDLRDECNEAVKSIRSRIRHLLSPKTVPERILYSAGLWPRLNNNGLLLHSMASTSRYHSSAGWTRHLTLLAKAMLYYQHSRRLVALAEQSDVEEFYAELDNSPMNREDIDMYSDWLLVQLDGNFIARPLQIRVAQEMILPSSGESTTLQLNMGEGKSSVIVPLVAAALANSTNLVRIVVLKSLAGQMFQTLISRISGLANHRIFFLPFSRRTSMTDIQAKQIQDLLYECARVGGVLVTQPEHILSFKLMRIDRLLRSESAASTATLQVIHRWLSMHARDILDESDEILHIRYQLIYTSGDQKLLDDSPDRWIIMQQALDRIPRHFTALGAQFTKFYQSGDNEGAFPTMRITDKHTFGTCVVLLAQDALRGQFDNLTFPEFNGNVTLRAAALRFVTELAMPETDYTLVQTACGNSSSWKGLLLLRGLLAHGILAHILHLRWRVDYGPDLSRTLMAVPYRAKDVPSPRAEFGHPDVAIGLTCLSYYYSGLSEEQLRMCFELLLTLDNPAAEYENWVRRGRYSGIPPEYHKHRAVNLQDTQRFTNTILPLFRRNQATINFYLNNVVFPKQAREYSHKLGVSAWDLVEKKTNIVTGFSGTSDSSFLLPTSINQRDPVNQVRTAAQVLAYLLRPENERYVCIQGEDNEPMSASAFLDLLVRQEPEIRVLLDVGAQMLELRNEQLIRRWLSLRPDIDAGVFFDDADQLTVLTQDGTTESLLSSSYSQQLGRCIVYLDDAHTRGTDLKLPSHFRAATTLGPKLTKDRLVQGCMRMRKLGFGQSVMFCAPAEVDGRIREICRLLPSDRVKVLDIIHWTMRESCEDILHHMPHWAQQGIDHDDRRNADRDESINREMLRSAWLQPEARTLEQLYGHQDRPSHGADHIDIPALLERLQLLAADANSTRAHMDEEQEREVEIMHETEKERSVEHAAVAIPATHTLDEDVVRLVETGHISRTSHTFHPLMSALRSSSASLQPSHPWSPLLLATRDFMTTTRKSGLTPPILSDYERPMNWILSFRRKKISDTSLVAISPFEANALLPEIRKSKRVRLHLFEPRVTEAMKPADDLTFYCIPGTMKLTTEWKQPSLTVRCQLSLWSGQLYLDSFETYMRLCSLLGLQHGQPTGSGFLPVPMDNDRFVHKEDRVGEMRDLCLFEESPVPLLKELFAMRRKGTSFLPTQMGRILHGRILTEEDFKDL